MAKNGLYTFRGSKIKSVNLKKVDKMTGSKFFKKKMKKTQLVVYFSAAAFQRHFFRLSEQCKQKPYFI